MVGKTVNRLCIVVRGSTARRSKVGDQRVGEAMQATAMADDGLVLDLV